MRILLIFTIVSIIILSGCAALFSEQNYVRVDEGLQVKYIWSGMLFTIPEKRVINKIVLIGEGHVRNIEIHGRVDEHDWKRIEKIKTLVEFPYEIHTYGLEADAIRILQKTMVGKGRIKKLELYKIELQNSS